MTPIKIRGAIMYVTGEMPNAFAESRGIAKCTLHRVIKNELQTESVRKVISEETGFSIEDLWTEKEAA